jgi:hypothetical protein
VVRVLPHVRSAPQPANVEKSSGIASRV